MISVYNSVLAQPALAQGAQTGNSAHVGATVDTALFGNNFRSLQFVISAQTITDGTHTFSAQESNQAPFLVTLTSATSGTFVLIWSNGVTTLTTVPLAFNASSATVLAALQTLGGPALAASWIVTGSAGGPYTVTTPFGGLGGNGSALLPTPASTLVITSIPPVGVFTAVDPSRVQGAPVLTSANSNNLFAFGVHHTLRYVQLVDTITGSTTGGVFSAVALGGSGGKGPVARA